MIYNLFGKVPNQVGSFFVLLGQGPVEYSEAMLNK